MNSLDQLARRIEQVRRVRHDLTPDVIYHVVYAGGGGRRWSERYLRPVPPVDVRHAAHVDRQVDRDVLDPGWRVLAADSEMVVADRDGLVVSIPARRLALRPPVGEVASVKCSAVSVARSPGFLHRAGNLEARLLSRIYVNVRPPDAWVVLGPILDALMSCGIECDAKVLAHPSSYHRADSGVVYVPSELEERAVRILQRVLRHHDVRLDVNTPALTHRFARGIGVADEPSDLGGHGEMSHGQWVTNVIFDAVQADSDRALMDRLADRIRRDRRDPSRPHRRSVTQSTL